MISITARYEETGNLTVEDKRNLKNCEWTRIGSTVSNTKEDERIVYIAFTGENLSEAR